MKMKKVLLLGLVLAMSLMALTACSSGEDNADNAAAGEDTSLQSVKDSGVLRVGMCPEYPPFESIDEANNIVGFDPELAAAIAEELGVEVECMNIPWESLIAGVNNGDFDVIMSAMSPEEASKATEAVELSDNYYTMSDVIVVGADNEDIKSKADLEGKVVGVQDASAAADAAESLADQNVTIKELKRYTRNADAYADLANGRIDAIIVGSSYANAQAKENTDFKVVNDPVQETGLCIVAKEGAVSLIEAMEQALAALHENGKYEAIETKWFAAE